jgi:Bacterial regulatory helix-turn-helix protein, lysR family
MDIDEISTFVAIAELGGFTRAAQRLHRTQPELRRGLLVELDVPAMRTAIPIVAVHRRNGYLGPAARRQRIEPPRRMVPAR